MIFFNRKIELSIFINNRKYTFKENAAGAELYIDFDILLRRDSKPNTAKITIYNLSEETRNQLSAGFQAVEFSAGYQSDPVMIFRGVIYNVLHEVDATGMPYTLIYAGDGQKELSQSGFNRSYIKGTPISIIVADIGRSMGLPIEIDFFQLSDRLPKGRSFHCLAKEALDQLAKDYNFNWTVLYQKLEITDKFFGIKSEPTAVLVSANTGMIGSPVIVELQEEDKKEKKNKKEEKRYGVKVSSLLNPEVRPGRLIRIEATLAIQSDLGKLEEVRLPNLTANGIYLVDTVRFAGSNYGADFLAEIEAGKLVA